MRAARLGYMSCTRKMKILMASSHRDCLVSVFSGGAFVVAVVVPRLSPAVLRQQGSLVVMTYAENTAMARNGNSSICSKNASSGNKERRQLLGAKAERKSSVNGRLMRIANNLNVSGHGTASNASCIEDSSCAKRMRIFTCPTKLVAFVFRPLADSRVAHFRSTRATNKDNTKQDRARTRKAAPKEAPPSHSTQSLTIRT